MKPWPFAILAAALTACGPAGPPLPGGDLTLLAQQSPGFAQASPDRRLAFPADHGSHPSYRFEWWYLTANLNDAGGRQYGAQWTLFRLAVAGAEGAVGETPSLVDPKNPWQDGQVFMAHMAVSSPEGHAGYQRYARGGEHGDVAQAGVRAEPFAAWLDDWALRSTSAKWLPLEVSARQGATAFRLLLDSAQGLVLQGEAGFSRKHPDGGGSHYYSQPYLQASGELIIEGEPVAVTGEAWLDREWSSQFLQPDQEGWDWFALHLDSGEKLMLYRIRGRDGPAGARDVQHGILFGPGGERRPLDGGQIGLRPADWAQVAGRRLPIAWRVSLPEIHREIQVRALHPRQWMDVDFAYWEGVVLVSGLTTGNSDPRVRGRGYLEMTGYR